MSKTLREKMMNDGRTKVIHLVEFGSGKLIEEGERNEIIDKYGDRIYCSSYSEGEGKVDIWVI